MSKNDNSKSDQSRKFINYARDAEADEDEARWEERLKKVAKQKPDKSE